MTFDGLQHEDREKTCERWVCRSHWKLSVDNGDQHKDERKVGHDDTRGISCSPLNSRKDTHNGVMGRWLSITLGSTR